MSLGTSGSGAHVRGERPGTMLLLLMLTASAAELLTAWCRLMLLKTLCSDAEEAVDSEGLRPGTSVPLRPTRSSPSFFCCSAREADAGATNPISKCAASIPSATTVTVGAGMLAAGVAIDGDPE